MSRLLPTDPVKVRIGDCECPDTPHSDGDHAYLRPRLTAEGGAAAYQAVLNNHEDNERLAGTLGRIFLLDGIVRWDILDDGGKPISVRAAIDGAVDWTDTLLPIADKADEMYAESVLRPFLKAKKQTPSPTS
jgi:hypothetical protein